MTMRDRQKAYFYKKLDENFPGIRDKYEKKFNNRYKCYDNNIRKLGNMLLEASNKYNISLKMPSYDDKLANVQLSFLK